MKGIEVGIGSETKAFKQGVDSGIIAPLENAADALESLGKSKGPDELEAGLKDAQTASKSLEKETKSTADAIERNFKAAYRDIKTTSEQSSRSVQSDFDETSRRGRESFRELGSEARQNASETFSSFDGSAQSFVDGVQGTFGGIIGSLGPIGAAAGAAGALGIGLISSALQNAQEEADKLKQRTADAFADMIESGNEFVSTNFVNEALKELTQDQAKVAQAGKDAKALDLDRGTILRAQVGDARALLDVHYAILAKSQDIKQLKDSELNVDGSQTLALSDRLDKLDSINNRYDSIAKSNDTAAKNAQLYLDATKQTVDGTAQIADNVAGIPSNKNISVTADFSAVERAIKNLPSTIDITPIVRDRNGVRIL